MCDATGDGPGFSGPGTGQHAHRTARGQHRLALLVVKLIEMRARGVRFAPRVRGVTGMASIMAGHTDIARFEQVDTLGYVERVMTTAAPLTMYTTSWCGYCSRLKTALKSEGIPYTEVDIESDPAAAEFVMSVNRGNQTVPTLKFADGSTLTNPSAREVKAKLF